MSESRLVELATLIAEANDRKRLARMTPPFDPQSFAAVYREALERGVDLLELNDATWDAS